MKSRRANILCAVLIAVSVGTIGALTSAAQTNHFGGLATRIVVPRPVAIGVVTNAGSGKATIEVKLPKDLSRYHVLQQHDAGTAQTATNLTATAAGRIRTSVVPGSTLMFVDKEPAQPVKLSSVPTNRALFSTLFVRADTPSRPNAVPPTASGTLAMFADVPTPWDDSSNAYVARLTVMFATDDANSPLLPIDVALTGTNVKSIEPREVRLERGNPNKEVIVICDTYRPDVQVTAHYRATSTTSGLPLQRLGLWEMMQKIISKPMLFAALTGGCIGGVLRIFKGRGRELSRILRYIAEGSTAGLVTVAMLLAGLLRSQIAGISTQPQSVLAFALAAAAGSVGAHFLDKSINQLRGAK